MLASNSLFKKGMLKGKRLAKRRCTAYGNMVLSRDRADENDDNEAASPEVENHSHKSLRKMRKSRLVMEGWSTVNLRMMA